MSHIIAEEVQRIGEALKVNQYLKQLNLGLNGIRAEGAKWLSEALKVNQCLQQIDLSHNDIGDEGAKWLSEALKVNQCLQKLNLSHNDIGDEGAKWLSDEALKVNQCLQRLNLGNSGIGDEGAKWLGEALKVNQCSQHLELDGNYYHALGNAISDQGAHSIGEALKINQCLQRLDLRYNKITIEGANGIVRVAQSNLGLVDLTWDFDLSIFEEELTPRERSLPTMAALLAHWRHERRCCRQTLLLGAEPPTLKAVHASPLWQSLARDELCDAQVWREIFQLAGLRRVCGNKRTTCSQK